MSTNLQLASGSTTELYEEVPLAELDKTGINIPTGSLSSSGREEIVQIVRESIPNTLLDLI